MNGKSINEVLGGPVDVTTPVAHLAPDQVRRLHCLDLVLQAPYIFWGEHDPMAPSEAGLILQKPITADQVIEMAARLEAFILDGR